MVGLRQFIEMPKASRPLEAANVGDSLQEEFDAAMRGIYERALTECRYNASYFIQMVNDRGGLQTAKHLLSVDDPQSGFTRLWELGRLDLTVEAHVLKPEFISLFERTEIQTARRRLDELDFKVW